MIMIVLWLEKKRALVAMRFTANFFNVEGMGPIANTTNRADYYLFSGKKEAPTYKWYFQ